MTSVMDADMEMDRRWNEVLKELSAQAPPASSYWLRYSEPFSFFEGTLHLMVLHGAMSEWIEKCVLPAHRTILDRYFPGVTVRVSPFLPGWKEDGWDAGTPAPHRVTTATAGAEDDPDDEQIEADAVTDPLRVAFDRSLPAVETEAGMPIWSELSDYALSFWAPTLGPTAYMTWMLLRYRYLDRDEAEWTPTVGIGVSNLALQAAGGRNLAITGGWRGRRVADLARRGEGRTPPVYLIRQPGALDRLQAEGAATVERREKQGRVVYRVRTFDLLPLLAPDQVTRLYPTLQEEHGRWLLDHAVDPVTWERMSVRNLPLPPMDWDRWLPAEPPALVPAAVSVRQGARADERAASGGGVMGPP